jgi:hypothetical protein
VGARDRDDRTGEEQDQADRGRNPHHRQADTHQQSGRAGRLERTECEIVPVLGVRLTVSSRHAVSRAASRLRSGSYRT